MTDLIARRPVVVLTDQSIGIEARNRLIPGNNLIDSCVPDAIPD